MKRVLIIAGDPSGDLIASQLVEAMKKIQPNLEVASIGGAHLKKVSDRFIENIVEKHAVGFSISMEKLMYFWKLAKTTIKNELTNNPPDAVIPVDFFGFNSCVAKMAKKMGHKVFYYASPQFWASRPRRADRMRDYVDLFLCLFPFEVKFYEKRNLPAKFVGHPMLDTLPKINLETPRPPRVESIIGLLPGSRPDEIKRHLPIMARAAGMISQQVPGTRFIVFTVPHVSRHLYQEILGNTKHAKVLIELIQDEKYQWRSQIDMAISSSGLETFENALLGIPMVIMYKTNIITFAVVRTFIKVPFIGMPNILAGYEITPEYYQWWATPQNIAKHILRWLKNPKEKIELSRKLLELRNLFGQPGASSRAAKTIIEKVA